MMEVERLKKIKYYEEEEKKKKVIVRTESLVVVDQIREREYERLKIQEEKEKEAQEMLRMIKQRDKLKRNRLVLTESCNKRHY